MVSPPQVVGDIISVRKLFVNMLSGCVTGCWASEEFKVEFCFNPFKV